MQVTRDSKALNRIISRLENKWQDTASRAVEDMYKEIESGANAENAVKSMQKKYPALFNLSGIEDALLEAAAYGYGIAPDMLTEGAASSWKADLTGSWNSDGMTLSQKLHGTSTQMRDAIVTTINTQLRKNSSWTEAARALYDGYVESGDVMTKQDMAAYMKRVRYAADNNTAIISAERRALNNISRLNRNGAPTKALKAAYTKLLETAKAGTEQQLANAVNVAINEKSRYVAERIIRTETARAWADGFWANALADTDVVAVQFKLSSRHPVYDICDMYSKADMFNLGAGIFPKNKAPEIPVHPHCLCRFSEIIDGEVDMSKQRTQVKKAGDKWLNKLSSTQRKQVLGVGGAEAWSSGQDWRELMYGWNGLFAPYTRLEANLFDAQPKERDSGAISGALNDKNDPDGARRYEHAEKYYEARRQNGEGAFVNKIYNNTGYPKNRLREIYKHVFLNEYNLDDGYHQFYPSYDMAQSFQRLLEGNNIREHDMILLKHEHLELSIMKKMGYNYSEAHALSETKFNYAKAEKEWREKNERDGTSKKDE